MRLCGHPTKDGTPCQRGVCASWQHQGRRAFLRRAVHALIAVLAVVQGADWLRSKIATTVAWR